MLKNPCIKIIPHKSTSEVVSLIPKTGCIMEFSPWLITYQLINITILSSIYQFIVKYMYVATTVFMVMLQCIFSIIGNWRRDICWRICAGWLVEFFLKNNHTLSLKVFFLSLCFVNEAETICWIARILGILQMNSYNS